MDRDSFTRLGFNHESMWWIGVRLQAVLILAPDGGDWSVLHPGRFIPGKEATVPIQWAAG